MIYPILLIIGDFLALLAAFSAAYILRVQLDTRELVQEIPALTYIQGLLIIIPFWLLINAFLGLYSKRVYGKRMSELLRLFVGSFIGILLTIGYDFIIDDAIFPARLVPVYGLVIAYLLLVLVRNSLWVLRKQMFRYGYGVRRIMVIGNTNATKRLASVLSDTPTSGYEILAIIGNKASLPDTYGGMHFSSLSAGLGEIENLHIDTVIQTEIFEDKSKNEKILEAVRSNHLAYRFVPAHAEFFTGKNTVSVISGFPVVSVHQTPLIGWGRVVKRLFDLFGTLLAMVIALPILFVVGIAIKISDPEGPIIFKHRRITRFGTAFNVYKLRSMYQKYSTSDSGKRSEIEIFKEMGREDLVEEFEEHRKVKDDPRIMPIGKFIRATSIDELPQLFNVLKGELSLVGPRPMVKDELKFYKKYGGSLVLSVKSGVTGLWQVSGRSDLSYEDRVKLDTFYVQNWSFWLDLRILLKTVWVVLKKTGAR